MAAAKLAITDALSPWLKTSAEVEEEVADVDGREEDPATAAGETEAAAAGSNEFFLPG